MLGSFENLNKDMKLFASKIQEADNNVMNSFKMLYRNKDAQNEKPGGQTEINRLDKRLDTNAKKPFKPRSFDDLKSDMD